MSSRASWGVLREPPGGLPTPYRNGIFDLLGVTVSWGPHQAHDQPLKLARQFVLEVCNEVLVEGEKGAGGPFAPQHLSVGPGSSGSLCGWQGHGPGSISAVTFPYWDL